MSNKIAKALQVVGGLSLLGGVIIGFSAYETGVEGYQYITDKDYTVLFTWIMYGVISFILLFSIAEIINLLEENKNNTKELVNIFKEEKGHNHKTTSPNETLNTNYADESTHRTAVDIDEMRRDLKERGYSNQIIESLIAEEEMKN